MSKALTYTIVASMRRQPKQNFDPTCQATNRCEQPQQFLVTNDGGYHYSFTRSACSIEHAALIIKNALLSEAENSGIPEAEYVEEKA